VGEESSVLYEAGATARITINRPEKRNALNAIVIRALRDAFERAKQDPGVRVVVLTGSGDRAFCAGADLGGFTPDQSKLDQHALRGELVELLVEMDRLGKPIVARVNGHALAGGFGLLCACDHAIAVDEAGFGMPEINIGLWPYIISVVVRRVLPERTALELMMTGRRIDAAEALRLGVVNRVVPAAELDAAVEEVCSALGSKSPAVMRLGRDSFHASARMGFREALDYLHGQLALNLETEDAIEGVTAFLQKRSPEWKGR